MKKGLAILLLGLLACGGAFSAIYFLRTAPSRKMMDQADPGLAWLKKEFHLSDAEFTRISEMHDAYLPGCRERCMKIAEQNRQLEQLLANATNITPEIRTLLNARAQTHADCEAEMMKHFLEVSRTMPPEQGRRYLEWVESQTLLHGQMMAMPTANP